MVKPVCQTDSNGTEIHFETLPDAYAGYWRLHPTVDSQEDGFVHMPSQVDFMGDENLFVGGVRGEVEDRKAPQFESMLASIVVECQFVVAGMQINSI